MTRRAWWQRPGVLVSVALVLFTAGAVVVAVNRGPSPRAQEAGRSIHLSDAESARPAPELAGITGWENSAPLTLDALRGKVVMVDFWTYTCVNCRRTFPFLRALHSTYADDGLVVVGVHSPEFDFEGLPDNVARAVRELGVTWAVAHDPQLRTWNAYGNRYWPASYFVDRRGRLRGVHIGEGGYDDVEAIVRTLLGEGGSPGEDRVGDVDTAERPPASGDDVTPELYLGAQRGDPFLGGPGVVGAGETVRRADAGRTRDIVYLRGTFRGAPDWVVAESAGAEVTLRYRARDVYVLVAPERGYGPADVEVTLDGVAVPAARRGRDLRAAADGVTTLTVAKDDLLHVITGSAIGEGTLVLRARAPGVRFVTFTFGA